jgi:flagellar biosynthesis protein FlhF
VRLKLYRAPVMADAMARIRAELGEDALILATRRVGDGVEVTAALEPDEAPLLPPGPQDPARLAALEFHAVPRSLHAALLQGTFDAALAGAMSFATLPLQPGEQPLLLVGPPGANLALTEAGVGPCAADGLQPITPEWLAARLLAIPRLEPSQ